MTQTREQPDSARRTAPRENRTAVVDPPFDQIGRLVADNVRERTASNYDFQGRSLSDLSNRARAELLTAARRWTAAYRDIGPIAEDFQGPIFLAGHQPELFHPGVWFKNFALGALGRIHGATCVNLIVDSDTIKTATLSVPGGTVARPQIAAIPFDRGGPVVPFEERRVLDRQVFTEFGQRVVRQIEGLVPDPLVRDYWPRAVARLRQTDLLGACLAQSRHEWESRWGQTTLEVPQSHVCQTSAFLWFAAHLMAQASRLAAVYNEAVRQYRQVHRIRNAAHPVPDLAVEDDWAESPFWIWTADDPRRRRLFVARRPGQIVLSDRRAIEVPLDLSPDGDAATAVEQLLALAQRGVKIRSRALITTLWARLILGDLFLHGIGGAKYDQVTDLVCERFFGLTPPQYLVLSATLHLPIPHPRVKAEEIREIANQLRELDYHPERWINWPQADPRAAEWLAAKRRWIEGARGGHFVSQQAGDTKGGYANQLREGAQTRAQHLEVRRINAQLQPFVADRRRELLGQQARTVASAKADAVLASREYGFCLFPEKTLRDFLLGLLPNGV